MLLPKICLLESNALCEFLFSRLNSLSIDHIHSHLFFEEELIGSSIGAIKSMKAEVYQVCHNYYSSRMDMLDSDMCSTESDIPPRKRIDFALQKDRVIRMMLKMSFFNECLASLTLQESNALYAYTRCLEYYTRVQDYCLSLFTKVFNASIRITNRFKIETTRKCVRFYPSSTSKSFNTACSFKTQKASLRHSERSPDVFMPCPRFSQKTTYSSLCCCGYSFIVLIVFFLESTSVSILNRHL